METDDDWEVSEFFPYVVLVYGYLVAVVPVAVVPAWFGTVWGKGYSSTSGVVKGGLGIEGVGFGLSCMGRKGYINNTLVLVLIYEFFSTYRYFSSFSYIINYPTYNY